ncbi:NAD(P)-dependent oxidoreductase, partial [Gammaproteobacteria bacterium]|nr:NAD(P)-dependent oxidoreductase [Gammaproteobacteria bacterium]
STYELSRVIENILINFPNLWGLFHVAGESINKYDLLKKFNRVILKNLITIKKDTKFKCNRSLDASRLNDITGYNPPSWDKMIYELNNEFKLRNVIKK